MTSGLDLTGVSTQISSHVELDTVAFVYADQPPIDRGWNTGFVETVLLALGLKVLKIKLRSAGGLTHQLPRETDNLIFWPASYTVSSQVASRLIVDELESLGLPYVGASARILELNSKLALKERLAGSKFRTPSYRILGVQDLDAGDLAPPCLVKTEFSCNSEGVDLALFEGDIRRIYGDFVEKYHQRVFIESWERRTEYTVAYIPAATQPLIAALEMTPLGGRAYIDKVAKADNAQLRFDPPSSDQLARLRGYTTEFIEFCGIDGHFRLDVLENEAGELFVIDLNFLPGMSADTKQLSYFPMALADGLGSSFAEVVCAILTYSLERSASSNVSRTVASDVAGTLERESSRT
jgi:D-alanine-D-alanine ligase